MARGLFQRQAAPLDEEALFSRWQSDLPGVGETYKVTHAMLLGLAVRLESNEGTVWHYLPREKLPTNPSACFEVLFDVKDKWSRLELDPYLDHMSKAATSLTQSELLLHYSKDIVEEQDGIELKYFNKK